jgi:hypothetical protein
LFHLRLDLRFQFTHIFGGNCELFGKEQATTQSATEKNIDGRTPSEYVQNLLLGLRKVTFQLLLLLGLIR